MLLAAAARRHAPDQLGAVGEALLEWKLPCLPVKPWQMTRVRLLIRMLMNIPLLESWDPGVGAGAGALASRSYDLAGRVGQITRRDDRQPAGPQCCTCLLRIRTLEAHDHRHLDPDVLDGIDDALGDQDHNAQCHRRC